MAANETLLSHIARHYAGLYEDVATGALSFIIDRSAAARGAFADFLFDGAAAPPPTIAKVQTQYQLSNSAPDLVCFDGDGKVLAFVESKFWAGLTPNQPVTYWQALPENTPTTLLFIAPPYRVNQSPLWDELAQRLRNAGHPLGAVKKVDDLIHAPAQNDRRRLMLCSWGLLFDRLAQAALANRDWQASFEIAEIQGLADSIIAGYDLGNDDHIKTLIRAAVKDAEDLGWANTERLADGGVPSSTYYTRYFRLAGAAAGLGTDINARKQMPDKPLILSFGKYASHTVTTDEVRQRLGKEGQPGLGDRKREVWVPIALPTDADQRSTRESLVAEIVRIAQLIDSNGPTYRDADAPHP